VIGDGTGLLEVEDLVTSFPLKGGGRIQAVNGVSLELRRGETLAVVGESGCGKSTLARSVLRLVEPSAGRVWFAGQDVLALNRDGLRRLRRDMQLVFQDPMASLDPRFTVGRSLLEPFVVPRVGTVAERRARVGELLRTVGLDAGAASRYPHEFSGGQRQRIGIARAIALEPSLVVLDEPVSALDVSIQSQILNLLQDLKERLHLSYLFISHDLGVVHAIADRVAVMYLGRVVEQAPVDRLFSSPAHPYTQALLASVPQPDPSLRRARVVAHGEPPSPEHPPTGCAFHPRCVHVMSVCRTTMPGSSHLPGVGHMVRCHLSRWPDVTDVSA
jgi:oligopeptide/dipeptide ABC transporter ATP-binding protein